MLDVYIRHVVQLHCGIFQLPRCGSGLVELAQPHHLSVLRVLDISHNHFFFGKGRLPHTWIRNHYWLEPRLPNCVDCFKKSKKFKDDFIAQKIGNVPDTPDLRRLGSAVEDEGPGSPGNGSSN